MKASATKGKASQLRRSHLAHRASGPSRSYLQTRIRGSRLFEAAFILAFIELSRRLHQAYAQAYDKQAADKVLPQNPTWEGVLADANALLTNSNTKCGAFVQDLLRQLSTQEGPAYSTDPKNLFDGLSLSFPNQVIRNGGPVDAGVLGTRATGGAVIEIAPPSGPGFIVNYYYATAAIHEAIHLAARNGRYDDPQLANAVYQMGYGKGAPPDPKDFKKKGDFIMASSDYWNLVLEQKCPPPVR